MITFKMFLEGETPAHFKDFIEYIDGWHRHRRGAIEFNELSPELNLGDLHPDIEDTTHVLRSSFEFNAVASSSLYTPPHGNDYHGILKLELTGDTIKFTFKVDDFSDEAVEFELAAPRWGNPNWSPAEAFKKLDNIVQTEVDRIHKERWGE